MCCPTTYKNMLLDNYLQSWLTCSLTDSEELTKGICCQLINSVKYYCSWIRVGLLKCLIEHYTSTVKTELSFMLFILCIYNGQFIVFHQQMHNLVFTVTLKQSSYMFLSHGIIIRESGHQMILYKTLNNLFTSC